MNEEKLKVYDNEYFGFNKRILRLVGLWPYASRREKFFRQTFIIVTVSLAALPEFLGIKRWCCTNMTLCTENISAFAYMISILLKFLTTFCNEEKMKKVFVIMSENWLNAIDSEERRIMIRYTKLARSKTNVYVILLIIVAFAMTQSCLLNPALDLILPLNETRPKMFILRADYGGLMDPLDYFYLLYVAYTYIAMVTICIVSAVDTTYLVNVHQSSAIFNIVKFLGTIETTYSFCMLLLLLLNVVGFGVGIVALIDSISEPVNFIRFSFFGFGILVHGLMMTWPGQNVIDQCENLFYQTYATDWYNLSEKAKTLLKIILLRSSKTVYLTAGGFYNLSFQNYAIQIKMATSFMAVALSLNANEHI